MFGVERDASAACTEARSIGMTKSDGTINSDGTTTKNSSTTTKDRVEN